MARELKVTVARKWKDPTILVEVDVEINDEGIAIRVPLASFLAELVSQTGNPTLLLTTEQLRRKIFAAADSAIAKMKAETARVM